MDTSIINLNTKLPAVYYNKVKLNLFRIRVDVTLSGLKNRLNQINCDLNYKNTRWVDNVEYCRPSTGSDRNIEFTQIKLENDNNVQTMFSIFDQYNTKGSIELDTSLIRSFEDIQKSMIRPRSYEEIKTLMGGVEEIFSPAEP